MPESVSLDDVPISDDRTKEWVSITGDTDDPLYDPDTYSTSGRARQFSWRAKDHVTDDRVTNPDCPGELLVEYQPDDGEDVGRVYAYGAGTMPIPLRLFMKLKHAALHDVKVPVESPVRASRGEMVNSSPGQFVHNELDYTVQENPRAFGYKHNFEEIMTE